MTSANIGQQIAIVIDGEVVSAPIVNEPILGGSVQISGGFGEGEAQELAIILQSAALPVPFRVVQHLSLD